MLTVGDLFSGIGGFSLGLERAGMRTRWFSEVDPYASAVLRKHWADVPNHGDIRNVRRGTVEPVDVLCGGFPCQDISSAGKRAGIDGGRSGLWAEYARVIGELRPRYVIVENVADLLNRGLGRVLGDMAALGYDAEWHCIPASFVGAPQARERVWIVAYPDRGRCDWLEERHGEGPLLVLRDDDDRLALGQRRARDARSWVRRANDGLPNRVDRLRCLGNSVVPQIVEIIGRAIMKAHQ